MNQKGIAPILIVILLAAALIGGYLVYTNYSNLSRENSRDNRTKITQPPPTTQPKPKPSPIPSDITPESTTSAASPVPNGTGETANWKTYTDNERGFSYKYPSTWNDLDYCSTQPTPGANELSANCIKTVIFTNNLPDENAESGRDLVVVSSTNIKVGGLNAKRKILTLPDNKDEPDTYEVWIYKNDKPFILWLTWIGTDTKKSQKEFFVHILDQILSTFRFN